MEHTERPSAGPAARTAPTPCAGTCGQCKPSAPSPSTSPVPAASIGKGAPAPIARPLAGTIPLDTLPSAVALGDTARLREARAPRYTSYPTADRFVESFGADDFTRHLAAAAVGYVYIGMDHFALPDDELAIAHRSGLLHRNFQGYSTQPDRDPIALGPSAISRVGTCYAQNLRGLIEWGEAIEGGAPATLRGIELTSDDLLRRAVIMALMCQGRISRSAIEIAWLIDFDRVFATELAALEGYVRDGHVRLEDDEIVVTERGRRTALRLVAAEFDRRLRSSRERGALSRVL